MFDWWHENEALEGKMFHMNVYPHHPLYQIPLPERKKEVFAMQKLFRVLKLLKILLAFSFVFSVIGSS